MQLSFLENVYEGNHDCVSWSGLSCADTETFSDFLKTRVLNRLDDIQGKSDFQHHLNALEGLTDMGKRSLAAVLSSGHQEERSWAAGEALAEAFLEEQHGVVFPWNMHRDERNSFGSLPGADIVGFVGSGKGSRLALGEVKSSSEQKYPPQVMSGRSGHMGHQLDELASNLAKISQLLKWLFPRVKGKPYEAQFDQATITFFNSGNKNIYLFGILVRDTQPEEKDVTIRAADLSTRFFQPTTCQLTTLYLPWDIDSLISKIRNGVGS